MSRLFPILPVLLLLLAPLRADEADDFIKAELERQKIPGLSLAVVREGKVIKAQGYGLANLEDSVAAKPETVFKIASLSKQFIATGIMLLVQDGKLTVEDKLSTHLPGTPESWRDITIRHLLTHTSGLVREAPAYSPFKPQPDMTVIESAFPLPLEFSTGEKYQYSNVGYFSLAEIISRVSGKSWPEFLHERVFAPLDMRATEPTNAAKVIPNRAQGYDRLGPVFVNAGNPPAVRPSGAFLSTVLDLAKWDAALMTDKPLPQTVLAEMWAPVKLNDGTTHSYGFGWQLTPFEEHRQIHHSGSLAGFRSHYSRFVDDRLSIIVLTNCGEANPLKVVEGLARLYLKPPSATAASSASP